MNSPLRCDEGTDATPWRVMIDGKRGASPAQVRRLRLTARCLGLIPVVVGDTPLTAELFTGRGEHVDTWCWQ
jgi:hypothetical protein